MFCFEMGKIHHRWAKHHEVDLEDDPECIGGVCPKLHGIINSHRECQALYFVARVYGECIEVVDISQNRETLAEGRVDEGGGREHSHRRSSEVAVSCHDDRLL